MMTGTASIGSARERVAVVTGAGRGIGQALAVRLAGQCRAVVGVDVIGQGETGDLVRAAGAEWLALKADVSSPDSVAAAAESIAAAFGGADILVNNAGIDDPVGFDELTFDRWRQVIGVDLDAVFLMSKALYGGMKDKGWGRIINISTSVTENAVPQFVAYRAAKMGVVGVTRGLACELGPHGITVNAVGPGLTRTAMALNSMGDRFAEVSMMRAIPRVALPDDLAGTIAFLASDAAGFVTGQNIMANGGATFS